MHSAQLPGLHRQPHFCLCHSHTASAQLFRASKCQEPSLIPSLAHVLRAPPPNVQNPCTRATSILHSLLAPTPSTESLSRLPTASQATPCEQTHPSPLAQSLSLLPGAYCPRPGLPANWISGTCDLEQLAPSSPDLSLYPFPRLCSAHGFTHLCSTCSCVSPNDL